MKNLFLLPTDKSSYLYKDMEVLFYNRDFVDIPMLRKNQHIYITSDEEIKEGDYYITPNNTVLKALGPMLINVEDYKKIILTTDQDLDGVQAIDDKFLEWFVKNPSCEEVEIGEGTRYEDEWIDNEDGGEIYQHQYCCYKIIIPKEEPKQETRVFGTKDDKTFWSDKPIQDGHPDKQETLEEAAEKWVFETNGHKWSNNDDTAGDNYGSFIAGVNYEAEQNKKNIHKLIDIIQWYDDNSDVRPDLETFKWFEKFKKK